jgi:peroxiredoxin
MWKYQSFPADMQLFLLDFKIDCHTSEMSSHLTLLPESIKFCYSFGILTRHLFFTLVELNRKSNFKNKMKNLTRPLKTTFFVALFVLASCAQNGETEQTQAVADANKAPAFEVTTIDGQTISLDQSLEDGKPVVVYFTASWCPTCARNWPAMSEVYPEYKDKLTMVAISIDPTDTNDVIRKLSEDRGFTFPSTAGNPQIMMDFGVSGQATTVGVDRDGNIAFTKPGQALSADEFRELFNGLLN